MIGTALATLLVAWVAMVPGVLLGRGFRLDTGTFAALATASLAIAMMVTALLGGALHFLTGMSLDAWALVPVSVALGTLAMWHTRGKGWHAPVLEWQGFALAGGFALYGLATYTIAVTDLPTGALRVHSWYNADWFKHLGHTFAIADYGIPARDIFGGGRPLHYYWLSYVLPGAGTAIGGDGWAALQTFNLIVAGLLCLTFYGMLRQIGIGPGFTASVVVLAIVACAPTDSLAPFFRGESIAQILYSPEPPAGPAFLGFAHYILQHALALALFLGQATLMMAPQTAARSAIRWTVLGGLATLLAISTLFGAALLSIYGAFELFRRRMQVVPELVVMAVASAVLVVTLEVIQFGHPGGAMESPLMTSIVHPGSPIGRAFGSLLAVVHNAGPAFLLCLFFAYRWKPTDATQRDAKTFALVTVIITLAIAFAVELALEGRLAREMRIRLFNLPHIFAAIVGGWIAWQLWLRGGGSRRNMVVLVGVVTLFALPSTIVRTAWHGVSDDRFTTIIPSDDRVVLADLRSISRSRDVVWQYPEKPFLSDLQGGDTWSVVLAGRTNLGTERATDYRAAYPAIQQAYRYFDGENVPVPQAVDWIYLSRTLHPKSYDAILARLSSQGSGWAKRACYPNACLFARETAR